MIDIIKLVEPLWYSKAAAYIAQQKLFLINGWFPFVFLLALCKGGVMRSVKHPNTRAVSTGHTINMEQYLNCQIII